MNPIERFKEYWKKGTERTFSCTIHEAFGQWIEIPSGSQDVFQGYPMVARSEIVLTRIFPFGNWNEAGKVMYPIKK